MVATDIFINFPYLFTANIYGGQAVGSPAASTALKEYNALKSGFANAATYSQLALEIPGLGAPNYFSTPNHVASPKHAQWSFEIEQPFGQKNVFVATYSSYHGYLNGFGAHNPTGSFQGSAVSDAFWFFPARSSSRTAPGRFTNKALRLTAAGLFFLFPTINGIDNF